MKNKRPGLFSTLVSGYVVFSLLLVLSLVIVLVISLFLYFQDSTSTMDPYLAIHDTDSILYKEGGWAEILDEELNVVEVLGEKQDNIRQYTAHELLELTNTNADIEYRAFINPTASGYELFKLPRDRLQVDYTFQLSDRYFQGNTGITMLFIFVALYILNCVLISLYVKRKISRPMDALRKGIQAVNERQSNVVVSEKGPREFVEIHEAFNDMVHKLNESESEKNKLEASRMQMLLDLSHDIKTPISTVKVYSTALRDGLVTGEKAEDYLRTIDAKVCRVNELLDDMFTLLKVGNTNYKLDIKKHDAGELTREICAEYYDDIQNAGLELKLNIPEDNVPVEADRTLLQRVMANLLFNAIKYNRTGNNIFVIVKAIDKMHAEISVEDDGTPIPEETSGRLFDVFSRGDTARTSTGGSGLGLSIAKEIVEKHNGSLEYKYENGRNRFVFFI